MQNEKKQKSKHESRSPLARGFRLKQDGAARACFERLLARVECESKPLLPRAERLK